MLQRLSVKTIALAVLTVNKLPSITNKTNEQKERWPYTDILAPVLEKSRHTDSQALLFLQQFFALYCLYAI
jgi:hypothetical protein